MIYVHTYRSLFLLLLDENGNSFQVGKRQGKGNFGTRQVNIFRDLAGSKNNFQFFSFGKKQSHRKKYSEDATKFLSLLLALRLPSLAFQYSITRKKISRDFWTNVFRTRTDSVQKVCGGVFDHLTKLESSKGEVVLQGGLRSSSDL